MFIAFDLYLECISPMELSTILRSIYTWIYSKFAELPKIPLQEWKFQDFCLCVSIPDCSIILGIYLFASASAILNVK